MTSSIFSLTLCIELGLPHPIIIGLTHYICGQSLSLMGIHLLQYFHGKECTTFHDVVWNTFFILLKMSNFIFFVNIHIFSQFIRPHFNSHNLLTLYYSHMGSALWLMLLSKNPTSSMWNKSSLPLKSFLGLTLF